jgi:hypothetical protein
MAQIYETVARFFEEDDWPFTVVEEGNTVQTGFADDTNQWPCFAHAREEQAQFVFYSVCPAKVPEEKRPLLAEFITRANYGLVIGNFEMDYEDGEIRYKSSIDVEGDRLSVALARQIVHANVFTMSRYLPGIMALLYGHQSAEEAIALVEEDGKTADWDELADETVKS